MNINAKTILETLGKHPDLKGKTIFIKVFSDHLRPEVLLDLLAIFRPDVIFLRRILLFTFLSIQKAMNSGLNAWVQVDSSDQMVDVKQKQLLDHIERSDAWFSSLRKMVGSLKLVYVDITYSGIFETGDELPILENFLSLHRGDAITLNPESTRVTIQDRRKDYFLTDVMGQYSQLPESMRGDLIRLPSFGQTRNCD